MDHRWSRTCLVVLLLACGCGDRASVAFSKGLEDYQAGRWDSAIRHFNQALVIDPEMRAAHFYVGTCYLRTDPPWPVVAAGELTLALASLQQDRLEPLPPGGAVETEARIHIGLGDAFALQAKIELLRTGKPGALMALWDWALSEYAEAAKLLPQDQGLAQRVRQIEEERAVFLRAFPFTSRP